MADVYSFGMVIYEMVAREEPFPEIKDIFELKKVKDILSPSHFPQQVCDRHKRPRIPKDLPSFLRSLMKSTWDKNPQKRPTFAQLKRIFQRVSQKESIPTKSTK